MERLCGPDSLDVVFRRFSDGVEVTRCVVDFCKEMALAERSYSAAIHKLLCSTSYTFHSNILMKWLGSEPYEEIGTVKHCWQRLGVELCKLADLHAENANAYSEGVRKSLINLLPQLEEARKTLKARLQQLRVNMENAQRRHSKEKQKYVALGERFDQLHQQMSEVLLLQLGAGGNRSRLRRLELRLKVLGQEFENQEDLYKEAHTALLQAHTSFTVDVADVYKKTEALELERVSALQDSLQEFARTLSNSAPAYLEGMQQIVFSIDEIDGQSDVRSFVQDHCSLMTVSELPSFERHKAMFLHKQNDSTTLDVSQDPSSPTHSSHSSDTGNAEEESSLDDSEEEGEGEGEDVTVGNGASRTAAAVKSGGGGGVKPADVDRPMSSARQSKQEKLDSPAANSLVQPRQGGEAEGVTENGEGPPHTSREQGKAETAVVATATSAVASPAADQPKVTKNSSLTNFLSYLFRGRSIAEGARGGEEEEEEEEKKEEEAGDGASDPPSSRVREGGEEEEGEGTEGGEGAFGGAHLAPTGDPGAGPPSASGGSDTKPKLAAVVKKKSPVPPTATPPKPAPKHPVARARSSTSPAEVPRPPSSPRGGTQRPNGPQATPGKLTPPPRNLTPPPSKSSGKMTPPPRKLTPPPSKSSLAHGAQSGDASRLPPPPKAPKPSAKKHTPPQPDRTGATTSRPSDAPVGGGGGEFAGLLSRLQRCGAGNDYYVLLGVAEEAGEEELARARRDRARELHPDHFGGDPEGRARAEEQLLLVNKAFQDALRNPHTRQLYNQLAHFRKVYSRIPHQPAKGLETAQARLTSLHKNIKKAKMPLPLLQELQLALRLVELCLGREGAGPVPAAPSR